MTLAETLAITTGIVFEVLLLLEGAQARQKTSQPHGIVMPFLSRLQEWTLIFLIGAWILIWNVSVFPFQPSPEIIDSLSGMVMFAAFSFLFVFGLVDPRMLPRVNEQSILVTNLVILPALPGWFEQNLWLTALVLLPTVALAVLVAFPRILPPTLKAFVYFWYLGCLLVVTMQSNFDLLFTSNTTMNLFDQFIAGQSGLFLLLNALFLVRFFLMLSALVLPANRHYIPAAMPQLFNDEQISTRTFFLLVGLVLSVLIANHLTGLAAPATLTNLLILVTIHGLDRSPWTDLKRV
jgi:hypothetical protein